MIEKMSKLTLLVDESRARESLKMLRKLGVLHVKSLANPPSGEMTAFESTIQDVRKAQNILGVTDNVKKLKKANAESILAKILDLDLAKKDLQRELEDLQIMRNWYENWSELSLETVKSLQDSGLYIKLYEGSSSDWDKISDRDDVYQVGENKITMQCALISRDAEQVLDIKPVSFPEQEKAQVDIRFTELTEKLDKILSELEDSKKYADVLDEYLRQLQSKFHFSETMNGMGSQEAIAYIEGYIPKEKEKLVEDAAAENAWGYALEDPAEEDMPPTKLKNAKWIQIIEPVFDFLGIIPGYRERDISMYFLVFFSIFVAMIIGDAGYGMIFLFISILMSRGTKKSGKKISNVNILLFVLSFSTIIWGSITGTWFGSVHIAQIPIFKALIVPQLASFPELFPDLSVTPADQVKLFCFILAIIQLGMACIMNFISQLPQLKSIAQLGWFSLLAGLFNLVLTLVLGYEMFQISIYMMIGGFGAIVIFGEQEKGKSFIKGLTAGLGGLFNTFLDSISAFSNIISYIRLFAVGMASVAIAQSFNGIAEPMMHGAGWLAAALVLLIGHGLNVVMGLLSVIVHGIRLNVLEFSGQLGLEWTGYKYDPFKENK